MIYRHIKKILSILEDLKKFYLDRTKIESNISYKFRFKYSNLDKPKGPIIGDAKYLSVKKNFKLNKDKF